MENFKKVFGWVFWGIIIGCIVIFGILPEFDLFSGIKEEAYMEGFYAGRKEGIEAGKESGFESGYEEGYKQGVIIGEEKKSEELLKAKRDYDTAYKDGFSAGKNLGYSEGYDKGYSDGKKTKTSGYSNNAVSNQPEYNYVINKNTKKFHYTWCSSVNDIKSSNRWNYSGMRDDIIDMGYSPCKKCNP